MQTEQITPGSLATHGHLLAKIPQDCVPLWIENCSKIFLQYVQARENNNETEKLNQLVNLLALPGKVLGGLRFGGERQKKRSIGKLNGRLKSNLAYMNGEDDHHNKYNTSDRKLKQDGSINEKAAGSILISNDDKNDHSSRSNSVLLTPLTDSQQIQLQCNVNRALPLLRSGFIGRATRGLVQQTSSICLNDSSTGLHQLLPTPETTSKDHHFNLPYCPIEFSSTDYCVNADDSFKQSIREQCNGSAPGISGWTGQMVKVLMQDDICLRGLAALVTDIINGSFPEQAREFLLASRLIAFEDNNDENRIKSFMIGEYFYRLAIYHQTQQVMPEILKVLLPIQVGVGVSQGHEYVVHTLQQQLLGNQKPCSENDKTNAAIVIYFQNGFNCISRHAVLTALYDQPTLTPLFKLADFAYSKPSLVFYEGQNNNNTYSQIRSSQGVKSGDILGSVLFALAVQSVYLEAQRMLSKASSQSVHGVLDECFLAGEPEQIVNAYQVIKLKASTINLEVNPKNCTFIYFQHDSQPLNPATAEFIQTEGMKLEQSVAIVLGAPLGKTADVIDQEGMKLIKQDDIMFHAIQSKLLAKLDAEAFLKACRIARMDYFQRAVQSECLTAATAHFQQAVKETAATLTSQAQQSSVVLRSPTPNPTYLDDACGFLASEENNAVQSLFYNQLF